MIRANVCPSSGAQDWGFLQHMVHCPVVVVGRGSERGNVALRVRYEGSCLTPSSSFLHTVHYTICCKKPQSCAPEDGQNFARNMLSWSWRSIKLLLSLTVWRIRDLSHFPADSLPILSTQPPGDLDQIWSSESDIKVPDATGCRH